MLKFLLTAIAACGMATPVSGPTLATPPMTTVPWDIRTTATVTRIIDGDTIVTTLGTIRVIGIDAPERGHCGFTPSTSRAKQLTPVGATVALTRVAGTDRDRYGRYLRYVSREGVDFGGAQIRAGLADARYDSRDGTGWHPRQASYINLDLKHPNKYTHASCMGSGAADPLQPDPGLTPTTPARHTADSAVVPTTGRPLSPLAPGR